MVREIQWATLRGDPSDIRSAQRIRERHRMELYKLRSEVESAQPETSQALNHRISILAGIRALEEETSAEWWLRQKEVSESFLLVLKKMNEVATSQQQ